MSKNMIRKGLALGSAVALGASAFVASPAYAVESVSLAPYYGTAATAVQDDKSGIVLSTTFGDIGSASASKLKYMVEIVNDEITYANLDDEPGAGTSNDFKAYTQYADRLNDAVTLELSESAATETDVTVGTDDRFVITPAFKDDTTVATTAGSSDTNVVSLTVGKGHGFTAGDVVTVAGLKDSGNADKIDGDQTLTSVTDTTIVFTAAGGPADGALTDAVGTVKLKTALAAPAQGDNVLLYLTQSFFDGVDADALADDTLTLKITAWVDDVNDNVIGNEFASTPLTVTFTPQSSFAASGAIDYIALGTDTNATEAKLGFTVSGNTRNWFEVNKDQGDALSVDWANTAATENGVDDQAVTWNAVLGRLEATSGDVGALTAGDLTSEIELNDTPIGILTNAGGYYTSNENTFIVKRAIGSNSVDHLDITMSQGAQNDTGAGTSLLSANSGEVLEGTKKLDFTVTVWDDAAETTAVGSGVVTQVTIKDVNGSLGTSTLTVEGLTLAATGVNSVSFTKNTNANGQISFSIEADKAVAGESFTVEATAEGQTKTAQTISWEEEDFHVLQMPSDINYTIAPKGSVSVEYMVVNQFGATPSGNFQLAVTRGTPTGDRADDVDDQAAWSYVVPVSATGRATVAITDNGSATVEGGDTVTVALQEAAVAGGGYIATGDSDTFTLTYETDWSGLTATAKVSNDGVAIGTTAVYPVAVETETLVDFDGRVDLVVPEYDADNAFNNKTDTTADTLLKISGTVSDADNDGVTGVAVVISGAGMNFASADSLTYASDLRMLNDSILVTTDANGDYEAFVRSSVGGLQTISVDAQGAKATASVTFAASTGAAAAMDLSVASSVTDGKTADVKVTVTDKLGNPVSGVTVTFKESGPGYLNTNSGTTDSDGEVIVNLITVAGDTGTSTITASATIAGVSSSVSKTMTVGATAPAGGKVNVGSFNGKLVVYALGLDGAKISWKVAGKWGVDYASGNTLNYFDRPVGASGVNVKVDIYVNGVLQLSKSVLTR